jgi:hypothetical protein
MSDTNAEVKVKKPKKVKDGTPKQVLLREATLTRDESGKVTSIIGKCTNTVDGAQCDNARTIKPQDAFQVKFCEPCQKRAIHRKIAEKRKARRAEAAKNRPPKPPKAPKAPKADAAQA